MIKRFFPTETHFIIWASIVAGAFGFGMSGYREFAAGLLLGGGMVWVLYITDEPKR